MKLKAILPLVTYPDCNSDAVAANAAAVAEYLGADLHAAAFNADIPDVSNAVSRFLLKLPELIKEAEAVSRARGDRLLGLVKEQAASRKTQLTTSTSTAALALLGEAAAAEARYFDVALLGWEAGNPTSRASAEAIVFGCGRPVILLPELTNIGKIDHVAIAWDGSRAAARAVADSARLLENAATVSVLTVVDEKPLDQDLARTRLERVRDERRDVRDALPQPLPADHRHQQMASARQQPRSERGLLLAWIERDERFDHATIRDADHAARSQPDDQAMLVPRHAVRPIDRRRRRHGNSAVDADALDRAIGG